jgi:CCR4-NOT transcription complex subunit 6
MEDTATPPTINRLRLVPDQPVEGCELSPDVFLMGGASIHNSRIDYHWYRSTEKMACSWCGKTPVTMQRLTDNSYYCSISCFVSAWPGHAAQHRTGLTSRGPRTDEANAADEWARDNESSQGTEQKWSMVAETQGYTPSSDDVGHMLKLACIPYSMDGAKRGVAKTLKTSYVISPPPPPTPRRFMMVRNNVAVSVGKPGTARTTSSRLGFTMLTYNVRGPSLSLLDPLFLSRSPLPPPPPFRPRHPSALRSLLRHRG